MKMRQVWKENQRGSSMVMVVAAIAMVSILVAVILSASLMNYQMKGTERTSRKNFYSAEGALEEIRAGIQVEVSEAFQKAYLEVMQNYAAADRDTVFQARYSAELTNAYKDSVRPGFYDVGSLSLYLDQSVVKDASNNYVYGAYLSGTTNPILASDADGLVLKNLVVNYLDQEGSISTIQTDIRLAYPDFDFSSYSTLPDLAKYALVANTGINVSGTRSLTVLGNLYGGNDKIDLQSGGTLTIEEAETVVANDVVLQTGGFLEVQDSDTDLWARNLQVISGRLRLAGVTHVANDLTVRNMTGSTEDGVESKVILENEYIGFGNPTSAAASQYISERESTALASRPADYSSAIVINGTNVTLDFSRLQYMMLAGNAYVATSQQEGVFPTNNDVPMGESLTVKSNQIAYLVPPEAVGVGMANGGSNPMDGDVYNALRAEYEALNVDMATNLVDLTKEISTYRASLSSLGVTGSQTVFAQHGGGNPLVYVYLSFADSQAADAYFRSYYQIAANQERLDRYVRLYVDEIQMDNFSVANFNLNGNVLVYHGDSQQVGYYQDTIAADTGSAAYLANRQSGQQDIFAALHIKLLGNYAGLTGVEKGQDVFTNLVDAQKIREKVPGSPMIFDAGGLRGVVVNGDYTVNSGNLVVDGKTLSMVIATGDVTLTDNINFTGLILAGGTVQVDGNCQLQGNSEYFQRLLPAKNGEIKLCDFLREGELYATQGGMAGGGTADEYFQLSQLIEYENWKKQ